MSKNNKPESKREIAKRLERERCSPGISEGKFYSITFFLVLTVSQFVIPIVMTKYYTGLSKTTGFLIATCIYWCIAFIIGFIMAAVYKKYPVSDIIMMIIILQIFYNCAIYQHTDLSYLKLLLIISLVIFNCIVCLSGAFIADKFLN